MKTSNNTAVVKENQILKKIFDNYDKTKKDQFLTVEVKKLQKIYHKRRKEETIKLL